MSSSASTSSASESARSPSPVHSRQQPLKRKRQVQADLSDNESDGDSDAKPDDDAEAPALSHAERRRQKKKEEREQKRSTNGSTSAAKKRKLKDGVAVASSSVSKKEKRQNSVWVGNLSFKTTADALRGFFDGVGEITRIHMPMKAGAKGENMGFAYVDFASPDHKVIAVTLSERDFQGRRLLIKDGDDFTGRPEAVKEENLDGADLDDKTRSIKTGSTGLSKTAQKILRIQKQPPAPTLFLGNLGFETTDKSIRELFEAHRTKTKVEEDEGEKKDEVKVKDKWMRKIRMGTFEDTGNCKGWAFIDFTSVEHATAALVNPKNHRLNGRNLVVEYASAEAVRRGGGGPRPKLDEGSAPRRSSFRGGRNGYSGVSERGKSDRSGPGDREDRGRKGSQIEIGRGDAEEHAAPEDGDIATKMHDSGRTYSGADESGGYKGVKGRSKPGAALALAKRESTAIVASQGQKIIF